MKQYNYPQKLDRVFICATFIGLLALGCSENDDNSPTGTGSNHTPVIRSVTANPRTVRPGYNDYDYSYPPASLQCVATDPDGDSLSFAWSCPSGRFYDDITVGQTVRWSTLSKDGQYYITVRVSDGKDLDTDSVKVTVQ